jgi:hypothetical protein
MPPKKSPTMSTRENAGLRGPVRQCTEERSTPAAPGFPETKFSGSPQESEITYRYKYESYGNWTEQAMQSKSRRDSAFENADICRRTITYY